ncbi:MAG: type VI secretion system tip protein VgrG, partial [Acidobacteria bacterium]|nr:type VI secretion system tip protein VgrG [Acidobacteriota bacterium]
MTYTQKNQIIAIETALGKDVLLLNDLSGREGISQLFSFHLKLLSTESTLAYEKVVGQRASISLRLADGTMRYLNGFLSRFSQSGQDSRFTHYEAEFVPWLWFLTRTSDCRIFQNKSVPEIIVKIFEDLGFTDFKNLCGGGFEKREYCVQYRETDFNFVSRLMEQEGIFYFFEHEKNKHTLVMAHSSSVHKACPEQSRVRCQFTGLQEAIEQEGVVTAWGATYEFRPGKYALTDYNFETPTTNLAAMIGSRFRVANNDKFEIYDYPGEYLKKADGEKLVRVRMEEEEATHLVASGVSTCRAFVSGFSFDLVEHYRRDANQTYVLTEVEHFIAVGEAYTSDAAATETYSNHFTCIPKSVPFRPPRVTPRPVIQGPQSAVVVGKSGEEIWVDKYGRVKVQFHWDRQGKKDENSSCWIRVSQPWAGSNLGAMWIPRIGQEVLVEFLEGDPDQPIITGRVYNAQQMPPYTLPDHQTRSTHKSRSSKGGGSGNYNEIRFEDKKGSEQLFLHAEKNMDVRVKEESREHVGKSMHLIVKENQKELIQKDYHREIKMNRQEKVGMDMSTQVDMNRYDKTKLNWAHEANMQVHIKAGMQVIIEAGAQLTLKCGGS